MVGRATAEKVIGQMTNEVADRCEDLHIFRNIPVYQNLHNSPSASYPLK
jgi:hypothetical protein